MKTLSQVSPSENDDTAVIAYHGAASKSPMKVNKMMTAKSASVDVLSGVMLMHSAVRLLKLDTSTTVGKAILGVTAVSMILQVSIIILLLLVAFVDYDATNHRTRLDTVTKVATCLVVLLAILETIASGMEAYAAGGQARSA